MQMLSVPSIALCKSIKVLPLSPVYTLPQIEYLFIIWVLEALKTTILDL